MDFFADRDTQEIAAASLRFATDRKAGILKDDLLAKLGALAEAAPTPPIGLLYGSGFEADPSLLESVSRRWPVLGNGGPCVAAVKDPAPFFAALAALGIPHPQTQANAPEAPGGWLMKRVGGAGGSHVTEAGCEGTRNVYFQRQVQGSPVSLLFVGNGSAMTPLGFSAQWALPSTASPWRYGGAVRPADLGEAVERRMIGWVTQLVEAFGLSGLGSADFLVSADAVWLLEVNPRPGATLDIFDDAARPLISFHLDAVMSRKLPTAPSMSGAAATAIAFAPRALTVPAGLDWPDWTSDIPEAGERIAMDGPICTVMARGETTEEAKHLAELRAAAIWTAVSGR